MPTKKNFLGGQQNYNKANGEYESSLVGPNGKVVKDADGDGIINEAQKKEKREVNVPYQKGIKGRIVGENEDTYEIEYTGKSGVVRKERFYKDEVEQDFNEPLKDTGVEKDFNEPIKDTRKEKEFNNPKEAKKQPELLSTEYFDEMYEKAGGDEDEMLDLIRADKRYQNKPSDPNDTWSMGDLQGMVEAYMDKKTGKTLVQRYAEKLSKRR